MSETYVYTVYRGTFIQLARLPQIQTHEKPELQRSCGALWVSVTDGRIKGSDWEAKDDDAFAALMSKNGWVDVDDVNSRYISDAATVKVKIIHAIEDRNEFFFPGFIGRLLSVCRIQLEIGKVHTDPT